MSSGPIYSSSGIISSLIGSSGIFCNSGVGAGVAVGVDVIVGFGVIVALVVREGMGVDTIMDCGSIVSYSFVTATFSHPTKPNMHTATNARANRAVNAINI